MNKLLSIVLALGVLFLGLITISLFSLKNEAEKVSTSSLKFAETAQKAIENRQFGALTSPDIISPYLSVGGVKRYYAQQNFITGRTQLTGLAATTSLICHLPFPSTVNLSGASTTILSAGAWIRGLATGTTPEIQIYKGVNLATTTIIAGKTMASSTIVQATTTLNTDTMIGGLANEYVNFDLKQVGGYPYLATDGLSGSCSATFGEN